MLKPRRVLVPMDFSDEAMLAWDWAILLAKGVRGAQLYPTYVYSNIPDLVALDVGKSAYKQVTREWVEEKMAQLRMTVPKRMACEAMYSSGKPAEAMVGICHEKGIDLVVMTTHGRHGVSHLLHGSVAEELVRLAPCPVLVLHMNRATLEPVHDQSSRRLKRPSRS